MNFLDELFGIFYAQSGRIKVATLENEIAGALGVNDGTVWLTAETLKKQRKTHPELAATDYYYLPNTVVHGVAVLNKNPCNQVHFCHQAKPLYRTRATIKATSEGELLVVTYHFARKRQTRSIMTRGIKLRNHSWKW